MTRKNVAKSSVITSKQSDTCVKTFPLGQLRPMMSAGFAGIDDVLPEMRSDNVEQHASVNASLMLLILSNYLPTVATPMPLPAVGRLKKRLRNALVLFPLYAVPSSPTRHVHL